MGVDEIIEEIKQLPAKDQDAVADFVMEITGRSIPLSGEKLEALAENLAASTSKDESARLKEEIQRGFYGEK